MPVAPICDLSLFRRVSDNASEPARVKAGVSDIAVPVEVRNALSNDVHLDLHPQELSTCDCNSSRKAGHHQEERTKQSP